MNLDELRARGGLVDPTLIKVNVTWEKVDDDGKVDPVNFDVFVRKNSFGLIDLAIQEERNGKSKTAVIIQHGVLMGDEGEVKFTYDQAFALKDTLAITLLNAFMGVNKPRTAEEKN